MATFYSVGPDKLNEDLDKNDEFKWVVYYYEWLSGYEATGEAIGLHKSGQLYYYGLGHCSCYGPFDGGLLSGEKIYGLDRNYKEEVKKKVHELLTAENYILDNY